MRNMLLITMLACGIARADTFNIEIDYMVAGDHTHLPSQDVIDAFTAPLVCQGHTVNVVVDDAITECTPITADPSNGNCGTFWTYDDGTNCSFGYLKDTFFDNAGDGDWYYGVFGHQYRTCSTSNGSCSCTTTGSSGRSNGAQDFIVTLGGPAFGPVGTEFDQAATLFHEFGHNLGLGHCGTQDCSTNGVTEFVPNMPSIMAYQYQLAGVATNMACQGVSNPWSLYKEIDYSHGRMCTVDETDLDEGFGSGMTELDWNCSGAITSSVAQDINGDSVNGGDGNDGWCNASGPLTNVSDYNEWANLSPGVALVAAAQSGDANDLRKADYRFIDPTDKAAVKAAAQEFLDADKRPDLAFRLIASERTGDPSWLAEARFVFFDPSDKQAIREFALAELQTRQERFDANPCVGPADLPNDPIPMGGCTQPTLTTESCLAGENVYIGTPFCGPIFCLEFGTCPFPYGSVQDAHDVNPSFSTYYLAPQLYVESGPVVLDQPGIWTCERSDNPVSGDGVSGVAVITVN